MGRPEKTEILPPWPHREILRANFEVEMVPLSHFHLLHLSPQDAAPRRAFLEVGALGEEGLLGCEPRPSLQFLSLSCD